MASEAQRNVGRTSAIRASTDPDEINLAEYLDVIWRYRLMIAILCVLAPAITGAWMLTRPRSYSSSATIVPPLGTLQKQSALTGGGLGRMGSSMLRSVIDTGSLGDMYVEILNSRVVADAIIERFDLARASTGPGAQLDARMQLGGNSKIEMSKNGTVKITVTDGDPNRCAAIANAYVEELDKQNKRLSVGEATSRRIFLENELRETEAKLSRIDSIRFRDAKVQEEVYQMLVQECELAKIEEARSMPTIQVLDRAMVPECPMGRGTVRRSLIAMIGAFMVGTILAFAHEHIMTVRRRRQGGALVGRYDIAVLEDGAVPAEVREESVDTVSSDRASAAIAAVNLKSAAGKPRQASTR
jgi:tyrosine-protein kinase Etk/Wzc